MPPLIGPTGGATARLADLADGQLVVRALGLDSPVFEHVQHASRTEQQDARAMNAALWPVIGGAFLRRLQSGPPGEAAIGLVRRHFTEYVRARGPLPAFRVGSHHLADAFCFVVIVGCIVLRRVSDFLRQDLTGCK